MTSVPIDETAAKPGAADLLEIFYAPRAVFARRTNGEFGLPLLALAIVVAIVTVATASLMQPLWDVMIAKSMAARPGITPEQIAAGKSIGEKFAMIGQVVTFVLLPFIVALLVWIVGRFTDVKVRYGVAAMIATFSLFPRVIGLIVAAVEMAFMSDTAITSPTVLTLSPARFVDAAHAPILAGALSRFDLFTLWSIFLIAVGLEVTMRVTRGRAWTTALIVWIIGFLPAIWQAVKSM
ncbi:MAG TPA: YIP1 family protein [Gemmatimonadales bacterium]